MTLFSNDAGEVTGNEVLGVNPRGGVEKTPWQRFRLSRVGRGTPGGQPVTVVGPAVRTLRRKMYRRRTRELVEEMNPL
ncbi:MAG: hypothetical protein WC379_17090 [Methanoregula sp.]